MNETQQHQEYNRIAKFATSPNVRLPRAQLGGEMLCRALRLFSRIELLHRMHGDRFKVLYDATQLPICFARRNPLADELDRLDPLANEPALFSFRNDAKQSGFPSLVSTGIVTDSCPADLYASMYEVRYLTMEEMAMVALRSLAREHLTDDQLEKTRTEKQRKNDEEAKCDADLFALSADVPSVDKSGWQEAAKRRFDTALRSAGMAEAIAAPFDNRPGLVTAIESAHAEESFAKPQENFYLAKFWSERASDRRASSTFVPKAANPRLYDADVEVEFSYLHAKTMDKDSKPHGVRAVKIPADLFEPEYDDAASKELVTTDPAQVDAILKERLKAALERYEAPVKTKKDMLELFGSKKRLDRFNALMEWRLKAFMSVSNRRAISAALIDALHMQLDVMERSMADQKYFDSVYKESLLRWSTADATTIYRMHPQLLQFVKGTDADYNDWECDCESFINERFATGMMEPFLSGYLFYTNCLFPALRNAENGPLCDPLPVNQQSDATELEKAFSKCWRTSLSQTKKNAAPSSLLQSNLRQIHEWPSEDMSVRRKDSGRKHIRGFILMLECEPTDCADPSNENNYGEVYRYSKRNLTLNPFYQFFEALFNFLLGSDSTRNESRHSWPEIAIFADLTLASACMIDHVVQIYRAINDKNIDVALADDLSEKLDRAVREKSWRSTAAAMLLDSPRANDRLTRAWQTSIACVQRAAAFDRTPQASARPFSTLYDYAAHCYKVLEAWKEPKDSNDTNTHKQQKSTVESKQKNETIGCQRENECCETEETLSTADEIVPASMGAARAASTIVIIPAELFVAQRKETRLKGMGSLFVTDSALPVEQTKLCEKPSTDKKRKRGDPIVVASAERDAAAENNSAAANNSATANDSNKSRRRSEFSEIMMLEAKQKEIYSLLARDDRTHVGPVCTRGAARRAKVLQ